MDRLELPKSKYQIHRQIESKNLSAFFITLKKGEIKYATERISQTPQSSVRHQDGRKRMVRSVLGRHPLCRIKYNGQYLSNADQNLSDEYRSKIADIAIVSLSKGGNNFQK